MKQYYFEDLEPGTNESVKNIVTAELIKAFADVSGDNNPLHLDQDYAATTRFGKRIAHGALTSSFISAVLGTRIPGLGTVYVSQSVTFLAPVYIGAEITTTAKVIRRDKVKNRVTLETTCMVDDKKVAEGEAVVFVPSRPSFEE